jgi:hypothetical protein
MMISGIWTALLLTTLDVQPPPIQGNTPVANWPCANTLIDRHYRSTAPDNRADRDLMSALSTHVTEECARPYEASMTRLQYNISKALFRQYIHETIAYRLRRDGIAV